MFRKKIKDIVKIDTLIGLKAEINGEITGGGNYKIDGIVNGNININGDVIVDKKAVVNGDISCSTLIAGGTICGNITANSITFRASAAIEGDSTAKDIVIEEGAKISGNCAVKTKTVIAPQKEDENE